MLVNMSMDGSKMFLSKFEGHFKRKSIECLIYQIKNKIRANNRWKEKAVITKLVLRLFLQTIGGKIVRQVWLYADII